MIGILGLVFSLALAAGDERLENARRLAASGQNLTAIAEFQKALESSPTDAGVWAELGRCRLAAGQAPAAVSDLSRAARLAPTDLAVQKSLAEASEKAGNPQRALVEWRRMAQISQGAEQREAEAKVEAILQAMGQAPRAAEVDSHPAAEPARAKAEAKAPPSSSPKAVANAATAGQDVKKAVELWKKGERDKALEILRSTIKKSPTAEAYYVAGVIRLEEKKLDMAEFNLRKATSDKKVGGDAWYWLGRTLEARKKPKEAKEAFKKSLEAAPKGEFATEARARLEEPKVEHPKTTDTTKAKTQAKGEPVRPEPAPQAIPDSLKSPYSWHAPVLSFPKGDGSEAGKLLEEAAKLSGQKQNDLALSTIDQLKLKESSSPSAELTGLVSGIVYDAMGLPSNTISQVQGFLKDHPQNPLADYGRFVEGIAFLKVGKPDSAALLLGPLPIAPKGGLWTESARQSAMGEALRLGGKHKEAVAALKLAFADETDARRRQSIALRLFRSAKKAQLPKEAVDPLTEARKGCDKSGSCLEVLVSLADLHWGGNRPEPARALYEEIAKTWPGSPETPWALYQIGTTLAQQGKRAEAQAAWKSLAERHPGSYWAAQARLRLEDAVWQTRYQDPAK